jgi:hypothetical protein
MLGHEFVQSLLPCMTEGRMPQVMPEASRLNERFWNTESRR